MGLGLPEPRSEQVAADERDDEKRRLSVFHLVGLAAGGVIGSGWLLSAETTSAEAGSHAWLSWLLGGLAMLVIAAVMVELGIAAPKTGGLIFLPWRSSGALVATVVAAGLWLFYAINLASEAIAMTKGLSWEGLSWKVDGLIQLPHGAHQGTLKPGGWGITVAFMLVISAVSLAAPWLFFHITSWLTVVKVVIPVLAVVSLAARGQASVVGNEAGTGGALLAVVGGGVIYSYMGFQGPLDFAGNIRRRGIGEAARLRWAVFGTILGSMALYLALQFVYDMYQGTGGAQSQQVTSPFFLIATVKMKWLEGPLWVGAILAPMGAGLVFAQALTREVAELSGARLTHYGFRTARKATFLKGRYDGYWLVVVVDFFIALIMLGFAKGSWHTLASITGVLALVVYAFPGVVLVSLRDRLKGYGYSPLRLKVQEWLARASFVLIAVLLYGAGWPYLWPGMATLAGWCLVLLLLPLLPRWRPGLIWIYDAKEHVTLFAQWRTSPAVWAATTLIGYLAALTLLTLLGNHPPKASAGEPAPDKPLDDTLLLLVGSLVVVMAVLVFEGLVRISRRHMAEEPPNLPTPAAAAAASGAKG